ncbi:MAG: hypothetical protein U0Q21_00340 [Dermatophilaceae bacterium]
MHSSARRPSDPDATTHRDGRQVAGHRALTPTGPALGRIGGRGSLLLLLTWLASFGMLQWSVVRFRVSIVLTLTVAAGLLAIWVVRRPAVRLTPSAAALALAGGIPIALWVPLWSYLTPEAAGGVRILVAVSAGTCALLLWTGRSPVSVWAIAVATYVGTGALAIVNDPHPKIDVWVTLQQAADALADGRNFYSVIWVGSPGVKDAFTYLPWSAVLLAPGRLVAGDVRWMLLAWVVVAALGLWLLGGPHDSWTRRAEASMPGAGAPEISGPADSRPQSAMPRTGTPGTREVAAAVTALVLLAPGTLTQIDQAWTEPLLWAGLIWWALLMVRGRPWLSVLPLALACASKQHLAAVLLVLLVWRPFGWRRTLATGALTAALIAPWAMTAPADFVHDTITFLVTFHPIKFANTWYLLALNEFGVTLPFWVTGLVVGLAVGGALWAVRRRTPDIGEVIRWAALVLFAANLVNKQAFYNQYWLVGALVALSLLLDHIPMRAVTPITPPPAGRDQSPTALVRNWRSED